MGAKRKETAVVAGQEEIARDIYDLRLTVSLSAEAQPGQFVGLFSPERTTLLPRPISVCEADPEQNTLRLVYRRTGAGTTRFAALKKGEMVGLLGMLGNGFPIQKLTGKKVLLLGGGIGAPPLLGLAKRLNQWDSLRSAATEVVSVLGYRDREAFLCEEFRAQGALYLASEDGSVGTHGTVLDAVRENHITADVICACGPLPMLRAVKAYAAEKKLPAYISLEERMACGVGVCLGCVCKTKQADAHTQVKNARICTEGPVFPADDVEI